MIRFCLKFCIKRPLFFVFCIMLFAQNLKGTQLSEFNSDAELFREAGTLLKNGYYDEALKLYEIVYEERLDSLGPNSLKVANVLGNIGSAYYQIGLYDKAASYYLKACDIYTKIGDDGLITLASLHSNLANSYLLSGDMEKARSYYENSDRIFQKLNLVNTPEYETLLINLTALYINNADYEKALKYNNQAFKISTKNLLEYVKWNSRGFIFDEIKDYKKSLECYFNALKVLERDHGANYSGKELIYNNLGELYLNMNEYDKALDCFEQSKEIILKNSGKNNASYSSCLNMIGKTYLNKTEQTSDLSKFLENKRKNIISALEYYQKALFAISPGYSDSDFISNPQIENTIDKTQLLVSLKNKAEGLNELSEVEEKAGNNELSIKNLKAAILAYQLSAKVIHLIRTGFVNEESRLLLAENERSVYTGAVNTAVHLFEKTKEKKYFDKAFEFSEQSRSSDFLTMVRNSRAKQFGSMPDSLLQKETDLKSEIEAYKSFVFNESAKLKQDLQMIDLWKTKIFDLEQSYSSLISLFEKEYPKYYAFKYANPIVSLDEVQSKLKPREALVEYIVIEPIKGKSGKIITFLITNNKYQTFTQAIDSTFDNSVNLFLQFLRNGSVFNTRKKDYVQYSTNAYNLYNSLISPFSREVRDYKLKVVPDGKLAYLPFDAFLSSPPDTSKMDFRGLKYLVYDYSISYTYSATLLYYYFNSGKPAKKELAAFVPRYDGSLLAYKLGNNKIHEQFFPLPGANSEVKGITKLIDGQVFKDNEATEENFKADANNYDILHLAMHTVINDSLPMYSKLLFSPDDNEDGSFDTYEVYNMNLNARMTVLSACNTGTGRLQKGEGVMSLARAFLYAGCPAIIMTLWSVEDESSADLMIDFYKNLLNGYSKDDALRKAKIKHI